MSVEIRAPELEAEGTRAQLLRWLKRPGEAVERNEPLLELETDKVTVEVPAPASGRLREQLKAERDEVAPGELLGVIEVAVALDHALAARADPAGVGNAGGTAARPPQASATQASAPASATVPREARSRAIKPAAVRASPAVQRLLREHGLAPDDVEPTGPGGRITVEDVLRRAAITGAQQQAKRTPEGTAPPPHQPPHHRVPHSMLRQRTAEHMVQSLLHGAPHVTSVFEADLGAVIAHRSAHRERLASAGVPLTFTAYFLAAAVSAIRAVPEANSRWTEEALELFDTINIGVATALGTEGLVLPVLRAVQRLDLEAIARGLHDLTTRAREGRLAPEDVRGGTFSISNHGVSGSLLAAPIVIPQGQSAILGIGRLERRVTVIGEEAAEQMGVRPKCYVTLTIDHRAMDGYHANRFLQQFVERLEHWPTEGAA